MPIPEREQLFISNYTSPIKYELAQVDRGFLDWLESVVPGKSQQYLDYWFSVVSSRPTSQVAGCYVDGGRVLSYNLPSPFVIKGCPIPALRIDAKGIGLTYAGFQQSRTHLHPNDRYKEIMYNPGIGYHFGWEELGMCKQISNDLNHARSMGLWVPQVVAIAKPQEFIYEGAKVPISKLKKHLRIRGEDDFAIALRVYPLDDFRINSAFGWHSLRSEVYIEHQEHERSLIRRLNHARKLWNQFEEPNLVATFGDDYDPKRYFRYLKRSIYTETAFMIKQGFSPSTPNGNKDHISHTHLQNVTSLAKFVEWTPTTYFGRLKYQNQLNHIASLIGSQHDAMVSLGLLCLNPTDFVELIPTLDNFNRRLKDLTQDPRLRGLWFCRDDFSAQNLLAFTIMHLDQIR